MGSIRRVRENGCWRGSRHVGQQDHRAESSLLCVPISPHGDTRQKDRTRVTATMSPELESAVSAADVSVAEPKARSTSTHDVITKPEITKREITKKTSTPA